MPNGIPKLTPDEVEDAIYIDFEGFEGEPPKLLGVLVSDDFEQVVLDRRLKSAADAKDLRTSSLCEELSGLIRRCKADDRKLVAFTQFERDQFRTYCGIDLGSFYADGHKIAKRWKNRHHYNEHIDDWGLHSFLRFIGRPRPAWHGVQQSAQRLRYVMAMLERRKNFDRLTPTAKGKWSRFLKNNEADCSGLRELMMRVAEEG